jgi:hypothetical protein
MGSSASPVFVHFPHPGKEHNPGEALRQPWNTGEHRRKFLRSGGRYVTHDQSLGEGSLVFWGEWEAPSYRLKSWPKSGALPRFLQHPVWEHPKGRGPRQNTDPWVFGECFRYSNCKQQSQAALRKLAPGSIILFGSSLDRNFVADTVFVVRDSQRFRPAQPPDGDDAFRVCTIQSLLTDAGCSGDEFILYRGATLGAPVCGMYSFVPCRREDSKKLRFCRPPITLPARYLNPASTQSPSGAKEPRSITELCQLWESVRQQVLDADCLLGSRFRRHRLMTAGFRAAPSEMRKTARSEYCGRSLPPLERG